MDEKKGLSQKSQKILIFLSWLMYTSAYLGRYSYNSNINPIMTDFGLDGQRAVAGMVTTFFFVAYGAGQVINGLLCKRYNKKYVLSVAMIISAVLNIMFFIGVDFAWVKYMWFLNGAVQSVLWSSLILVLSENLDAANLKGAIVVMSTSVAVGTFISYGGSALFVHIGNYRLSFLMGGIVTALVGITWFILYGRISLERTAVCVKKEESVKEIKPKNVSGGVIAVIAILAFFAVVDNLVKDGLNTWVPVILKENYGLNDSISILLTLVLPILGVFGATFAMFMNRRIKSYVSICGLSFGGAAVFVLGVILLVKTPYWLPILLCFGIVVFAMHAVNNVITSMAPLYMRDKVNSGMVAGVLDGFCYAGSAISSYGLGVIADNHGWTPVFYLFLITMGVSVVVSVVYGVASRKNEN